MSKAVPSMSPDRLRADIIALGRQYIDAKGVAPFIPGQTYIPCTGKVVGGDELASLLDASLDMWLTAGRYAELFEAMLAKKFGLKHARLTTSGSAANLLAFASLTSWKLHERRVAPGSEVL